MQTKVERFEARLTEEQKALFTKAAMLQGKTRTDFIISSALEAAKHTLQHEELLDLTLRGRQTFVEALLAETPMKLFLTMKQITSIF